jgi:uncharacterized protein (TIGR02001 family)
MFWSKRDLTSGELARVALGVLAACVQAVEREQLAKSVAFSFVVAASLASSSAIAADMAVKAPPASTSPAWDIALTGALMTGYNFRGITQSNHQPSTQAGFEPRYNFTKDLQGYFGVSGESIDFPDRAVAEIDFYGGVRPTFGKLALDFGAWYYYYAGGQCFNGAVAGCLPSLPNGNVIKQDLSFYEGYGKATYTVNDNFNFGGSIWGSPSVLDSGASSIYYTGNVTLTAPPTLFANGVGAFVSADVGYWELGTSDSFYGVAGFLGGIPYTSYWNWDAGLAFTWKAFTLDLRYYGTNLSKGDCNAFTSDQTAGGTTSVTAINPSGVGSNWCGSAFIAKLSFATTINTIK